MGYREALASFLIGMEKIFGALVVLTLAWATGDVMQAVGLDRFFGEILTSDALDYRMLPTLSFVIAIFIAFSTGTSWGTMTIMFPLVLVPSYNASNGDPVIFYGVTAGILAGAVAGDHASPISDTTILSSMASECQILEHVKTQAPYAIVVATWSILVGTIPSGRATFANWVSILLGFFMMVLHVVLFSEFTINKTGRYDILTEIYLRCTRDKDFLLQLKADTVMAYETGQPVELEETQKMIDEEGGTTFASVEMSSQHEGKKDTTESFQDASDRTQEDSVVEVATERQINAADSWSDHPSGSAPEEEPPVEEHFASGDLEAAHSHEQ
jgi:hypothetical protein